MQERHSDHLRYFNEQAATTRKYYIPFIKSQMADMPKAVLEVGCGQGGNLLPFAEAGCDVTGVDINGWRIGQAREFFGERGFGRAEFIDSDVFKLTELHHKFDLFILHDVIEHVGDKAGFLGGLRPYLAAGGYAFVAFPAWQMPFGGHQQIADSKFISHAPYIHILPKAMYMSLLKMFKVSDKNIRELLEIKDTRCPIELFERRAREAGYEIVRRQLYLVNPHYETKFGLRPRKLWSCIAAVPVLRNFFSTSCWYILRPKD